jgi:hypothetical protein
VLSVKGEAFGYALVSTTWRCEPRVYALCVGVLLSIPILTHEQAWAAEPPAAPASKPGTMMLKLSDDVTLSLSRIAVTYGTLVRAQGRDPELLPAANAARVNAAGRAPGGVNIDDGNLNYDKGDHVSTAFKGIIDIELKHGEMAGAFVRARAWHDHAQRSDAVPHGNLPNNYAAHSPLSDAGFSSYGRFSNAALMDAYVYGTLPIGSQRVTVKAGQQPINWGRGDTTILGGLEQINAIDYAARYRAGALPNESYIPVPALFARWEVTPRTGVEAFYLLRYRENENSPCGTFFALADYVTDGCDKVLAQGPAVNDAAAVSGGVFARRAADRKPGDSGQFGIGITYRADNSIQYGLYFANYHSRRGAPSAVKSTRTTLGAIPLIPGDPGGENVRYFMEYPDDVRMFGLNLATVIDKTRIYAEYTYRPNQSILLNPTDLFNAFASNTAPSLLRADATATPAGGTYPGFDRREISQVVVAASRPLGTMAGAAFTLSGEAGMKYIHDLPDVNVRRYGRSDFYGLGPVNGVCIPPADPKQCSNAGFVSAFSWGYRAKVQARYHNMLPSVDLIPSIGFAHDVQGWSHDIIFIEGRKSASVGVRAEFSKAYFIEASWKPIWGGDYNFIKDRDFYSVAAGIQF